MDAVAAAAARSTLGPTRGFIKVANKRREEGKKNKRSSPGRLIRRRTHVFPTRETRAPAASRRFFFSNTHKKKKNPVLFKAESLYLPCLVTLIKVH